LKLENNEKRMKRIIEDPLREKTRKRWLIHTEKEKDENDNLFSLNTVAGYDGDFKSSLFNSFLLFMVALWLEEQMSVCGKLKSFVKRSKMTSYS
jgi:hypothetical protein